MSDVWRVPLTCAISNAFIVRKPHWSTQQSVLFASVWVPPNVRLFVSVFCISIGPDEISLSSAVNEWRCFFGLVIECVTLFLIKLNLVLDVICWYLHRWYRKSREKFSLLFATPERGEVVSLSPVIKNPAFLHLSLISSIPAGEPSRITLIRSFLVLILWVGSSSIVRSSSISDYQNSRGSRRDCSLICDWSRESINRNSFFALCCWKNDFQLN